MIELNRIDDSVLKAINMVRARAYGVDVTATDSYPAVTTTDQTELRRVLRIERRMEFAMENQRLQELMRWKFGRESIERLQLYHANQSYGTAEQCSEQEPLVLGNDPANRRRWSG